AELLEKLGRFDAALEVWHAVEARDPKLADSAARAAAQREKLEPAAAPRAAPAAPAQPAAQSRYAIHEELGRGARGVVFKARDKHLGRVVALKRLTESLRGHPTAVAFFEREARAAAALNHPNIVTVYDAGNESGQYFITMEFLQGTTLDTILRARGAMAAPVAAAIGMQVCAGLHYAHTSRIIHRDIKTANLFYTRERTVKIMDFGLAKMVEEVRKGATVIGGTPFYMAPEQAAGERVDHRADLYALGVTLFELLTKSVPFRAGDVTFHHRNTPAPDPRERIASIPAPMAELVMKLMQKQPEARYQSAAEVAAALQPIAGMG
ncbi:MAG: serine/threonine-protein kinase, partial [Myxococcota bacterium]